MELEKVFAAWNDIYSAMQVRTVQTAQQKVLLQISLHSGRLMFETDGRPDGLRPHEARSYFDYYQQQAQLAHRQRKAFQVREEVCLQLSQEMLLFFARFLAYLKLDDHTQPARKDADQIQAIIEFQKEHLDAEEIPSLIKFESFFNQLCSCAFRGPGKQVPGQSRAELEDCIARLTREYFSSIRCSLHTDVLLTEFEPN
jgi:hypothetical protein